MSGTEAFAEAAALWLGLPLPPEYRPGVILHLEAARAIAAEVLALDLGDEAEPAPVWTPPVLTP